MNPKEWVVYLKKAVTTAFLYDRSTISLSFTEVAELINILKKIESKG